LIFVEIPTIISEEIARGLPVDLPRFNNDDKPPSLYCFNHREYGDSMYSPNFSYICNALAQTRF
jgi:hypothetical protein